VDDEKFPEFDRLVKQLRADGFQLVPIIDAAVKKEEDYPVCEEGKTNGYFCVDDAGEEFVCGVWPGPTYLPDFLRPDVRTWWARKYAMFTDLGIRGFWNDMNEPAIFYTPERLKHVAQQVSTIFSQEHLGMDFLLAAEDLGSLFNRREYFRQFYHTAPDGKQVNHEEIHNLYGFNMVRAAAEGFQDLLPNTRYLLISRSSYAGLHRFAGIWTGDNDSWWEHLLLNIKMLMSLNMVGLLYTGADIGGFGSETSSELMIRWMQFGIFSPLCRNHTWFGARDQEPWRFDDECTGILRDTIRLRYALLPYTYTEYMRAARDLEPLIMPLLLEFEGEPAREIEDQFLYGQSVMVAPVYTANARGRFVHLPECRWLYWKASRYEERQMQVMNPGNYYVQADLQEIPIFLRENHLMPLTEPTNYMGEAPIETLTVIGLVTDEAEYTYYDDDGETFNYRQGQYATLTIRVKRVGAKYEITSQKEESGGFCLPMKSVNCEIYNENGDVYTASLTL
jgi:alpha-glucosidase